MGLGKAVKAVTVAAAVAGMLAVSVPAMAITHAQLNQLNNEDTQFQQRALQAVRESQKGDETLREQMLKQQARARARQKRIQAQAAQERTSGGFWNFSGWKNSWVYKFWSGQNSKTGAAA